LYGNSEINDNWDVVLVIEHDVVLFHSHPAHSNLVGFSDWDLKNQEYFYLKMIVYSVNNNEFYYKSI
jgi:hypothetical protein